MSNRKVKKNKAKKKTTNYKQLGAVGLGGTFLGALATRGMFDRKQLLNIKDCDEKIKQIKQKFDKDIENMESKCDNELQRMGIKYEQKYQGNIDSLWKTIKTLETAVEQLRKKNINFKNLNKNLETELQKSEKEREQFKSFYNTAKQFILTRCGEEELEYFMTGKMPGKYLNRNSFGQKNFSKKQLMTMLNNKKISKKQLLTMLVSSIVSGGATRVYSKRECDRRIMEICGSNVPETIPRKKNIEFENSIKALDSQNNDLALANKYLQKELEKCKAEKEMLKKWFGISYDDDLGAKPKFTYEVRKKEFGRKRIKSKVKKIPSSLKKKCKRLKVRLTTKRGGKRVYKSIKVLKKQCSNTMKKKC